MSTIKALKLLIQERISQDEEWGGPEHDDQHVPEEWLSFIMKQADKAPYASRDSDLADAYVKIGALALAALESMVRKGQI